MRIDGQQGAGAAAARPAAQRRTDTGRLSCLARNGGTPGEESRSWPLRRSGPAQRLADRWRIPRGRAGVASDRETRYGRIARDEKILAGPDVALSKGRRLSQLGRAHG